MKDNQLPFVSVLAPCRNEAGYIEKALKSILESDYPSQLIEILILDGLSDDGTREIVREMIRHDDRIRLIDNPNKIVPSAMNIGIAEARGEFIVRIDCHTAFATDYISKCIEVSQRTAADNVGGYMQTLPGDDTPAAKAIAAASMSHFGVGNSAFRVGGEEGEVDTVPFGTYKKDHFEKIGLYDERLVRNQDIELNSRIRRNGGKIIISPEIKLSYFNRATYSGLWQQAFNNGLWNLYTIWLAGGGLSIRHFVPMVFVFSLIVLAIASCLYLPISILLLAEVITYSSVGALMAVKVAAKDKVSITKVLRAFLTLHIAYGLGSLWAVITIPFKFPSRNISNPGKPIADRKE